MTPSANSRRCVRRQAPAPNLSEMRFTQARTISGPSTYSAPRSARKAIRMKGANTHSVSHSR